MKYKIGFIGAGNMAFALAKAIKNSNLAKSIIASDVNKERIDFIKKELKIDATHDNSEVVNGSDIIFIAVKPQAIDSVLDEIQDTEKLIISIAAGVKISKIEGKLKKAKIGGVMQNTHCLVAEMEAGFAVSNKVTSGEVKLVAEILSSAGKAFYLKEEKLDAVTGLSGSGPAFVARLIEAFIEAGQKEGLNKDMATELAVQTFLGTAKLLQESGMSPDELVKLVSSPNGTTVAGREILEKSDYKDIIIKTIKRATERSKELGR